MFLKLLVTLVVLLVSISAEHLRSGKDVNDSVEDHARGARTLKKLIHNYVSNTQHRNPALQVKALVERGTELRAHPEMASELKANSVKKVSSVQLQNSNNDVRNGYFLSKYRPNGDCSGEIQAQEGQLLGCTQLDNWSSILRECSRENEYGEVYYNERYFYNSPDCSNWESSYNQWDSYYQKCQMGYDVSSFGFRTMASQCGGNHDSWKDPKAGLFIGIYNNDTTCTNSPVHYTLIRTQSCMLSSQFGYTMGGGMIEGDGGGGGGGEFRRKLFLGENNQSPPPFTYMRLDECTKDGHVRLGEYSDAACTRRLSSSFVSLKQDFDNVNKCRPNNGPNSYGSNEFWSIRCNQPNAEENATPKAYDNNVPPAPVAA